MPHAHINQQQLLLTLNFKVTLGDRSLLNMTVSVREESLNGPGAKQGSSIPVVQPIAIVSLPVAGNIGRIFWPITKMKGNNFGTLSM